MNHGTVLLLQLKPFCREGITKGCCFSGTHRKGQHTSAAVGAMSKLQITYVDPGDGQGAAHGPELARVVLHHDPNCYHRRSHRLAEMSRLLEFGCQPIHVARFESHRPIP